MRDFEHKTIQQKMNDTRLYLLDNDIDISWARQGDTIKVLIPGDGPRQLGGSRGGAEYVMGVGHVRLLAPDVLADEIREARSAA